MQSAPQPDVCIEQQLHLDPGLPIVWIERRGDDVTENLTGTGHVSQPGFRPLRDRRWNQLRNGLPESRNLDRLPSLSDPLDYRKAVDLELRNGDGLHLQVVPWSMDYSTSYQPTGFPLFCSSSHFCSGAK